MPTYAIRAVSPEAEKALFAYSPFLRCLLASRGILTEEDAERFLKPDYDAHTHDPFLMKDMEKAVARILSAIERDERIAIWSDYDADGIPGAVALHDFFKRIGYANFQNYIPDRHAEGFGLNISALKQLRQLGCRLLITIDCGITDTEAVTRANELGMEVIVTDHHVPNGGGLPPAYTILNPKQPDCLYPEKMLCGSGVVFKLIQAMTLKLATCNFPLATISSIQQGWEKWLLDMVGIATLSDMVPLTGENRVFAHFGLKVLRKSPRKGLGELLSLLRIDRRELTEDDVGFSISPRINAASRMGVPMDAFRLFATEDDLEARELARHLNKINDERKGKVASLVKEVRKIVAERHVAGAPRVVVAGNPNWRPALLGLVANALAEDYRKPVFVWGRDLSAAPDAAQAGGGKLKGSCRSDGSTDLHLLMHEARHVFSDFGGHREAGGFSVVLEKVHLLEAELERAYEKIRSTAEAAGESTGDSAAAPERFVDARLTLTEVSFDLWREVSRLAPFGVGNPKPLFLFEGVSPLRVETFGKEKQHLKLVFQKQSGERLNAIRFFAKPEDFNLGGGTSGVGEVPPPRRMNLLAHLEKSTYGNYPELRLRIVDVV